MPRKPVEKTVASVEMKTIESDSNRVNLILKLVIDIRRRIPFMNVADANVALQTVFMCNNYVRYVEDQKVSMYIGAYVTKGSTENETATANLIASIAAYDNKITNKILRTKIHHTEASGASSALKQPSAQNEQMKDSTAQPTRSAASIGLGRLLSAARASTKGETIGAPMAAFVALGNRIFEMSHDTVTMPLNQALAFLKNEPLQASISKHGSLYATIFDYIYRDDTDERICVMNYWQFLTTQASCKLNVKASPQEEPCDKMSDDTPMNGTCPILYFQIILSLTSL